MTASTYIHVLGQIYSVRANNDVQMIILCGSLGICVGKDKDVGDESGTSSQEVKPQVRGAAEQSATPAELVEITTGQKKSERESVKEEETEPFKNRIHLKPIQNTLVEEKTEVMAYANEQTAIDLIRQTLAEDDSTLHVFVIMGASVCILMIFACTLVY